MGQQNYRHTNKIDYLGDFPGARREKDVIVVELNRVNVDEGIPISELPDQSAQRGGFIDVSGEAVVSTLDVPSATRVMGQVTSSGEFGVDLVWLDPDGNDVRSQRVGSGDDEWVEFNEFAKASAVRIEIVALDGDDQVAEYTVHMT